MRTVVCDAFTPQTHEGNQPPGLKTQEEITRRTFDCKVFIDTSVVLSYVPFKY